MAKWIIGGLLTAAVTFIINLVIYLGVFKDVDISMAEKGPYLMIYKEHVGPYHKVVATIEEVEKWVKSQNEPCTLSFGEYLDNPDEVEHERLKSHGGCIVSEDFYKKIQNQVLQLPEKFKTQQIEQQKFVRGYFQGSPAIGPFKVYPKMEEFLTQNNLKKQTKAIEIYEIINQKQMNTEYLFFLEFK